MLFTCPYTVHKHVTVNLVRKINAHFLKEHVLSYPLSYMDMYIMHLVQLYFRLMKNVLYRSMMLGDMS